LGHIRSKAGGRVCGCGRRGCLETYASAPGLKRTVFELIADDPSQVSKLKDITFNELESKHVYEEAIKGDPIANKAFEVTGEMLGIKLADAAAHTAPKAIFFFGGLAKSGNLILDPTRRSFESNLLMVYKKGKIILDISKLFKEGKNIAVLGAAALAWDQYEKERS